MAQLQSTSITGSFTLGTSSNLSAEGFLWLDITTNTLFYSTLSGSLVSRLVNLG